MTIGAIPITSYPRLTLDFHTNKRVIDEVVRIRLTLTARKRLF